MAPDELHLRSRLLFILALISLALAVLWSVRTVPAPNSDRYDYLGRAHHALRGDGLSPHVAYPLRLALPAANQWPLPNLSRPPLWPGLLSIGMRLGLRDATAVVLAGLLAVPLVMLLRRVGDATFGSSAGAMAALVFVSSFATVRAIWGGGPELALALLTFVLWTWTPALHGRVGYLACGSVYGLLPLLHPVGWLFALLAFLARSHRYSPVGRRWVFGAALVVAAPWYVHWWMLSGHPFGFVQAQAELAKAVRDPGGLGPYRTLDPEPTGQVLREDLPLVLRTLAHRVKERAFHLDAWLSWPLLALSLVGMRKDPPLALRDLLLLAGGFLAVSLVSAEPRLALPLLPVAATWCGAGFLVLSERIPRMPWVVIAAGLAALPWLAPVGAAQRPPHELRGIPSAVKDPSPEIVQRVGSAGTPGRPMITDSAVLAWRAKRLAIFLPQDPATLQRIRQRPLLAGVDVLVLGAGRKSRWIHEPNAAWLALIDGSRIELESPEGPLIAMLPSPEDPVARAIADGIPTQPVGPQNPLAASYVPDELIAVPQPPATRDGIRLHPMAWNHLREMLESAAEGGLELKVVSGYRPYVYQEQLYRRAVEKHGEDQAWVAKPGESEHQLGTTVDLADGALAHMLEQSFAQTPEGLWLERRAPDFGFVITYTDSSVADTGILPEPWHVRYLGRAAREQ